jgi:hypothetical protein
MVVSKSGVIRMENQDITYKLLKYENQWVAILEDEERIVGSGSDAYEAQQDAINNGYSDIILMRVRSTDKYYAFNNINEACAN